MHHAHQQTADQRTAERAHAADHHHHEGDAQNLRADKGLGAAQGRKQHPSDTGQGDTKGEGHGEQAENIGAQ
ncbi:hypothetical protein PFLmoz3_00747 [Pseudomonas fluorescens]|uniref:Uncharacterized protein n=1 Tax=Pseudomonas fluorescens TaxID=294 RepID=A0A120G902_PSEFL|nr:hypothetical protein PFLmoz3_00747 [Pseudomonas fluorescens]